MGYTHKNYFIRRKDKVHSGVEAKKSSLKILAREKREMIQGKSSAELWFRMETFRSRSQGKHLWTRRRKKRVLTRFR